MSSGIGNWNESKIVRKIKTGDGQGSGIDYKVWYQFHEKTSTGRRHRLRGTTVARDYHLFSDLEYHYFLLLDWMDSVIDIREHYPLINQDETIRIAETLKINHPRYQLSKSFKVLTSDFFINVKQGNAYTEIVRTVIPAEELDKKRILEVLEIERTYWESRNIDWGIVTDKDIPMDYVKNLIFIRDDYELRNIPGFSVEDLNSLKGILKENILTKEATIHQLLTYLDKSYNTEVGTFLHLFKHLVVRKEVEVEMNTPIHIQKMTTSQVNVIKSG
jgi:hypothetical protein